MTEATGSSLSADAEVRAAIAVLECASEPVPAEALPALRDPAVLAEVQVRLATLGRQLLQLDGGFLSGYDDAVADRLATEGIGVLDELDRAVLAAVFLLAVAIPRAHGRLPGRDWRHAEHVSVEELLKNPNLAPGAVRRSLRRLRAAGILTVSNTPGPQFARLSGRRTTLIWENLVLLCRPEGGHAAEIRRRRAQAALPSDEEQR